MIFDHGSSIELRPIPDDPIAAVRGSMPGLRMTTDEIRQMLRDEEAGVEARKWGR